MASPFDTFPEPEVPSETLALGVHQSDVVIRTALVTAIADIRRHPYLLDFVFASLKQDDLTSQVYGAKEVARAKEWFTSTDVPVVMDYLLDDLPGTCVTISLVESGEAEVTLGDVHYEPFEDAEATWPALTSAFDPVAYSQSTGVLTLPDEVAATLVVVPGMSVVCPSGTFTVVDVVERNQVVLTPGLQADFHGSVIKGAQPRLVTELESVCYKETYRIGCRVHGEPVKLNWLYSVVAFVLLRYKKRLLEARGFERSVVSWAPFAKDERTGGENMWVRFATVSGFVRQTWPGDSDERIGSVGVSPLLVSKVGSSGRTFVPDGGNSQEAAWWAETDGIGVKF